MGKLATIRQSILNNLEEFKQMALVSTSLQDLGGRYGLPSNGQTIKWLRPLLKEVGVDERILKDNLCQSRSIYPAIVKQCPECDTSFTTERGAPKEKEYCSRQCANKNNTFRSEECKSKISESLISRAEQLGLPSRSLLAVDERNCQFCGKSFLPKLNKTRFCSPRCRAKETSKSVEHRAKLSAIQRRRIADGSHKGWANRGNLPPSYPELFFQRVLIERGIAYETEVSCGLFWIDFAIVLPNGFKIALEIDGAQHKLLDRQMVDRRKTLYLERHGWNVYRIEWCSVNTDSGKQRMKRELDLFVDYQKAMSD